MGQVFWSGGIGDIITLEATMTDEYRRSITRMYWATPAKPQMSPLFAKLPSFPNLQDHVSLWNSYEDGSVFHNIEDAYENSLYRHLLVGPVEDWSTNKRFCHPQPFNYSSFIKYKLANLDKFNLPTDYIVVCPYSTVATKDVQEWRRFLGKDWKWLLKHLDKNKTYGVVLNTGADLVPESKWLINLSNKTTLAEAIEITKKASGYMGIGMAFSVIAAQMLEPENIVIVASDKDISLCALKHIHYAPKTVFDFMVPHLGATDQDIKEWIERSNKRILDLRQRAIG